MKLLLTILFICMVCFINKSYSQQSAIYSQYLFNGLAINPAYAGHDESLSLTFLARMQSVGLEGTPNTQTFSAHTPVKRDKIGLGLQLFHETIGVSNQSGVYMSYSYRLKYRSYTISFGLQAGANFYRAQYTSLMVNDPGDPVFESDYKSTTPNFGSGIFLNNDNFFAGLSLPQMFASNDPEIIQEKPFFIYGGYLIDLTTFLKLKPSTLVKIVNGKPVEWDISTSILINDILWAGVLYRPANAFSFIFEMQVTEQLQIGYAYDITLNELHSVDNGSHEIMINYRFRFSQHGVISPRYF